MNQRELSKIQLQCRIVADMILMRNSRAGYVSEEIAKMDDEVVIKDAEELKKLIEEIIG